MHSSKVLAEIEGQDLTFNEENNVGAKLLNLILVPFVKLRKTSA
jgi:hypothetical protein